MYDSSHIKVSDIRNGVVGQPSQFRVDASQVNNTQTIHCRSSMQQVF